MTEVPVKVKGFGPSKKVLLPGIFYFNRLTVPFYIFVVYSFYYYT